MTISKRVQKELYSAAPAGVLPPLALVTAQQPSGKSRRGAAPKGPKKTKSERALAAAIAEENKGKAWTDAEHARFLEALRVYPSGPWKAIADFVGTKNSRQTMTHAQKYRQKHERRERGLRNRTKHRKAARTMVAASTAAATAYAPHACSTTTASTRSQRMSKRAAGYDALVIPPSTPQHSSVSSSLLASSESPRSGEESTASGAYVEPQGVDALMESVDATVAAISGADAYDDAASWEQLKISSISEMFQDFEPMSFLPNMWSTTSLGDIEAIASAPPSFGANELFSDCSIAMATNPSGANL